MKTSILRCLAALFLCGFSLTALADDTNYIINEDFSELPSTWSTPHNNWVLYGTHSAILLNDGNTRLKLEGWSNISAYAISPQFSYEGDVILIFTYTTNKNVTTKAKITIEGEGSFKDDSSFKEISFSNDNDITFKTDSIYIISANNTKVKFQQTLKNSKNDYVPLYLDDVKVIKLGSLTLDETIDSSEPISVNKDRSCTVATQRKLTAGIWNTMCLPFNLTHEQAMTIFGEGVQLRTYSGYDATNKVMNFVSATNVSAGTPFLIKPTATVTNPTFTNVTITDTPAQAVEHDNDGIQFVGTYAPVDLATDGTNLFITTTNTLAKPTSTGNKMNGLRAYIVVPSDFSPSATRLAISDDATAVTTIQQSQPQSQTVYDLRGQRLQQPGKGLRIMNGKIILEK